MKDIFLKNSKFLILSLFLVAISAGGVGMFYYLNSLSKEVLYYNLSQEDASKIVEKLKENKISYTLENGGRNILVDSDKVSEVRLMLASNGLPSEKGSGFEIFDKTRLGISGFSERVNYRRALEGELARSISSIEGVKYARVHIAIPEPNIFVGKQEAASASVVVHFYKNFSLNSSQIKGIVNLVSGAVDGLKPENVSITDGEGRLIKPMGDDWDVTFLNEAENFIEKNISNKISEILDKIYGSGKTIVSVDVSLDMDKIESVKEIYNPNTILASSSSNNEEINKGDEKTKRNNSDVKYLSDKTIEKFTKKGGDIKRLSVSIAVSSDIAQTEVNKIKELVASACGFDEERGDVISINFFNFSIKDQKIDNNEQDYIAWKKEFEKRQMIKEIIKYSSFIISSLLIVLGLYLFSKKVFSSQTNPQNFVVSNNNNLIENNLKNNNTINNTDNKVNNTSVDNKNIDIKKEFTEIINKNSKDVSKFLEDYLNSNISEKEKVNVST